MILLFYVCLLLNVSRFISVLFSGNTGKAESGAATAEKHRNEHRKTRLTTSYISVFCSYKVVLSAAEKQLYSAEIVGYTS